jgi:predicted RNA-binding Zn ribbon-like protein
MRAKTEEFPKRMLCLDFANTAQWHASGNPQEHLNSYHDLVDWSRKEGILSEESAQKLISDAIKNPSASENVFRRAIELREAIYHIFSAVASGALPEKGDLAILNRNLSKTMEYSRIIPTKTGFKWETKGNREEWDGMLNPVIRSAAELLTSDDLNRIKECADDRGCGWLFLDRSRNRSRRWCDMKDCGNRAKAKRFYQRRQKND